MQYKRFVSYVFQYEGGTKGENIGFARVEFCEDKIMLNVHFRIRNCVNEWLQLYLFKNENHCLSGMPVGKGRMKWNTFDLQTSVTADKMKDYSCIAEELKGLYIKSETGKIFASVWDDGEVPIEEFHPIQLRMEENDRIVVIAESEAEREEIAETEADSENEITVTAEAEFQTAMEADIETEEVIESKIEADIETEEVTESKTEAEMEEIYLQEEIHEQEEKYEQKELPVVEKMDLSRLRRLIPMERELFNNRFLLHGYYNYHYLYLKKINKTQAVIGVPGIFHPMEKTVAQMYGFTSFCAKDDSDVRNGVFGYWCRTVALDISE